MKKFKILFSVAVASAIVGCSSMAVDDEEALEGNLPADFRSADYMAIHPELARVQYRDYVTLYNANVEAEAKKAGDEAVAAFKALKETDEAEFLENTEMLHGLLTDPYFGGFTEESWELSWQPSVKTDTVKTPITIQRKLVLVGEDTLVVYFAIKGDSSMTGSISRDSSGAITAVEGFTDSTLDAASAFTSEVGEGKPYKLKGNSIVLDTVGENIEVKTEEVAGGLSGDHIKMAKQLNLIGISADYDSLRAVPVDTFAISYQFVMYGRDYGWAYRFCTEAEKSNPVQTEVYPVKKLYCDDNGIAREIK